MTLPTRMDALTGLRALAALAVVGFHARTTALLPVGFADAAPALRSCYAGVDLFFILSGFVLMHAHGRELATPDGATIRRFYALRLARIYPVHFTILMLLLAGVVAQSLLSSAGLGIESRERFAPDGLVHHLLLVGWSSATWNPPAWSLSAEWTAYLAFPVLAWLVATQRPLACAAALAVLAAGFAAVYAWVFGFALDQHGLLRVAFEFPAGCLLYRIAASLPVAAALAILALTVTVAIALFGTAWGELALVPALAALILAAASANPFSRLLSARWLVWLGEISYSLYMVHLLVLGLAARASGRLIAALPGAGHFLALASAVAAAVLCAAALHYAVERPAREFVRRWVKQGGAVDRVPAPLEAVKPQMRPS